MTHSYQPDHCGFITPLPEQPFVSRKCDLPETQERCYDEASYSLVYNMQTSLRVDIICTPIDSEVVNTYSSDIMAKTLQAMTQSSVIKTQDVFTQDEEHYKLATLLGEGQQGNTNSLFFAQLWIDAKSALSVKAEIVGDITDEANTHLANILRGIHHETAVKKEN